MSRPFKIACLQTRPMPDIASALKEAMPLAEAAVQAGAKFIFLPEYCGGLASNGTALDPPAARENEHGFLQAFRKFADENKIWVMLGSIAITGLDGKIINSGFVIDDLGNIQSRYDKIHLFDVQISETEVYRESTRVTPGRQATILDTPFGCVGHTICYDLRFPHLYRELSQAGAEILCVPAAFVKTTGEAHWHVLNRARAIENGAFVVSPCAVGDIPGGGESYGHSVIVNPWGEVIADAGSAPGVIFATIDIEEVKAARSRIPALDHDRPYTVLESKSRSIA